MTPRDQLVVDLVKDVLGPRNGPYEEMENSPLLEYITGVLAPLASQEKTELENVDSLINLAESGEEDDIENDVRAPLFVTPPLDPQHRPSSFGISFAVKGSPEPLIDICVTWACYTRNGTNDSWRRNPYGFCERDISVRRGGEWWFTRDGTHKETNHGELSLHLIARTHRDGANVVNLYFVNRIKPSGSYATVEDHIFQPQIRIVCGGNTQIVPLARFRMMDRGSNDEAELEFLYRHRRVMARGFLCSATWKDIDPEHGVQGEEIKAPPFFWVDGETLSEEDRNHFVNPDVRTEFVPLYHIPAPDFCWPREYGPTPELRAGNLCEKYDPEELKAAINPLVRGYERWIESIQRKEARLTGWSPEMIDRLIQRCRIILERMKKSLQTLINDENARLAFCFASKAMDLQARWIRGSGLEWRPFQLGYIMMVLESLVNSDSEHRTSCDLLWVPTGAGKTEAYLFLILFVLALRRLQALDQGQTGAGVAVITRYTLRLLTIQQFRRLLTAIMAAEYLRVSGLAKKKKGATRINAIGWYPAAFEPCKSGFVWGCEPFGAGLWVGGGVTPNRLRSTWGGRKKIPGAIDILAGKQGEGEPAQVITCPACGALLALPETGLQGRRKLHLVVELAIEISSNLLRELLCTDYPDSGLEVTDVKIYRLNGNWHILELCLKMKRNVLASDIDRLWKNIQRRIKNEIGENPEIASFRASRPGYFPRWYIGSNGNPQKFDFEIICPSPKCPLIQPWCAGAPAGEVHGGRPGKPPTGGLPEVPPLGVSGSYCFVYVQLPFRHNSPFISSRIPIQAFTVDEQIYARVPSVVVATADKFARPAFEPRAAAIFGVVDHHHCVWGYYRKGLPPQSAYSADNEHPVPIGRGDRNYTKISELKPPELIIQDELHLMEGPLGSLAGFYETAVSALTEKDKSIPKYIASTATIRNAREQVAALFNRDLTVFPVPGIDIDDRFFVRENEKHPAGDEGPGRLYVGICAPGRGPLTPLKHIYARLLQTAQNIRISHGDAVADSYWTLVGYFNALRELGGARALCRQDIPARISIISVNSRKIHGESVVELSSRTRSTELPAILEGLERSYANDLLLTTSMFGTGVDISRLSLMVVNGQPKTTSSYIQATGRVGRRRGALVVTFLRAARPRDLNHYESFCGYHRQLHRYVEPVTVYPFSSGVLDRAGGPVSVFILRNMPGTRIPWFREDSACRMAKEIHSSEVSSLPELFENRAQHQPGLRRPFPEETKKRIQSLLELWQRVARRAGSTLKYSEYVIDGQPKSPVVLGDAIHRYFRLDVVYDMAPTSLRDIEEECSFEV